MRGRILRGVLDGAILVTVAAWAYLAGQRDGLTTGRAIGQLEGSWRAAGEFARTLGAGRR